MKRMKHQEEECMLGEELESHQNGLVVAWWLGLDKADLGYILNVKLTGVVCFLIFILEYN